MTDELARLIERGLVVWAVIMIVESGHGILRQLLLAPLIGDFRARQVSVFIGSLLILAIALIFVRWLKGNSVFDFVVIGVLWVALTVGFEVILGRLVMNLSWERIASDYNLAGGGLLPVGLLVMLAAPLIFAKFYAEV